MKSNTWYYVPAQYDGATAIPVQIWVTASLMSAHVRALIGCSTRWTT
jgi:hypothetical protein